MINFYDTSSLLLKADSLFEDNTGFAISSITLNELENIKTSNSKSEDVKYAARKLLHILDESTGEYELVLFKNAMLQPIEEADLSVTNDSKILACAHSFAATAQDEVCFVTNDLALKSLAKLFFTNVDSIKEEADDYSGYKEVRLNEDEMSDFYTFFEQNKFDLLPNEYLIVRTSDGEIVDRLCWTGEKYRHLTYQSFRSKWFGDVRPMKGDVYQACAADSLSNNRITMLKGPAGSGKTYMAMAYLLHKLDRGELDKIIVDNKPQEIVFDLKRLTFADSSGIGVFIGRYKTAKNIGCKTFLTNTSKSIDKIFTMAGIYSIIPKIS